MSRSEITTRAIELRSRRVAFVLAKVVLADRPTSAKPGDEAIVHADGTIEGFVGGACAESTVRAQALALLDSGESRLLRITPTLEAPSGEDLDGDRIDGNPSDSGPTGRVPTGGGGRVVVHNPCLSGGSLEIFLSPEVPVPLVAVVGDAPVAVALLGLGAALGYDLRRFDGSIPVDASAIVVASHGRDETEALRAALLANVPYVGLVASRKRGEAVVASLDVCASMSARVVTPAGLDIGARTPEEVALSILADIVGRRPQPSGRSIVGCEAAIGTALDPVCGMTVTMVDASMHLDHDQTRHWFCGSGCLRAFAATPADYIA